MKKLCVLLAIIITLTSTLVACSKKASPASDFKYTLNEDKKHICINRYIGDDKDVVIPDEIDGYPVKMIMFAAFLKTDIESVTIPNTVEEISERAFAYCKELHTVNLGKSVKRIGFEAFINCIKLKNISLPQKLEVVERDAFTDCDSIEKINIPKTLTVMGEGAFFSMDSLTTIEFEQGLTKIGNYAAFQGCSSLQKVVIPRSVKEIGTTTFSACKSLKEIKFLGDAPEKTGEYIFGPPSKEITIYYKKNKSGWDTTPLKDEYTLIPY
ncbi:MAG: leucine-rich repeat domain-containing protein [Clostridia bacterium]|nr:leucine-rich repeat domain-containing protein [Clostridia bacterium]